jgi:nitrite reductase (NADH) small subunit
MTEQNWQTICSKNDLVDNSGVCALMNEQQVAIFKIKSANTEQVFAVSNWDPVGKANVLYRGLLGSVGDSIIVAAPLYKQRYCLESGKCLDDENLSVTVYPIRVEDDKVQLQLVD